MITFDENTKVFHLSNNQISYLMSVEEGNLLAHLYFGKRVGHYSGERLNPRFDRSFSGNLPGSLDRTYSKDTLLQEWSGNNTGDYRAPAVIIRDENGARQTDFRFQSYKIIDGKPELKNLPHAYVKDDSEAQTLIVNLLDENLACEVELSYSIYNDRPIIARSAKLINKGRHILHIEKIASMQIDFPKSDFQVISLPGAHARERQIERQTLHHGLTQFESRRGTSSHHMNPFIALIHPSTTEFNDEAIGIQLVYSGNHQETLERDYIDQTRVLAGINQYDFDWKLRAGDSFQTPEALIVYSSSGLNGMSQTYHRLLRERVARGKYQFAQRPIVINNWEATFFDFDTEKIQKILDNAAPLGIEMFVLDDGWFGHRDDDNSSLGDWFEHATKLRGGLKALSQQVHDRKMKFGLWFEPEMISEDSELYKKHPDYALQVPGRGMTPSRGQYVLDFSRKEVVDNIFNQMTKILDNVDIDYVKWDMNRHLTEVYSTELPADRQGEVSHRYVLGVYDLAQRITSRYPDILFEGCSGGGGRFDAGMLYYFPQSWTSDNTDAVARLKIQYGSSLSYPVSSMTAHVSVSPNQQTGRQTSFEMRGDVAMAAVFGYELNLADLSDKEKEIVKSQIKFYKKHRQLIQYGDFIRLKSPFDGNQTAWEFVSPDKKELLLYRYKLISQAQPEFTLTKLAALDPDKIYLADDKKRYAGDELMNIGLYDTPIQLADWTSRVDYFQAEN
ncbi:alpha-galactosidase [Oenococcus oeni S25]|uniref:alpha-galactosidase n=1 Tax=Oenococcus oeni TaxID=1247 RepID=UPI00050E10B5|nr:alpha-galactosidase [Oenococcus oeni]KGH70497.1 alpha-galactosidase [Oenococcus oeni S25]KGH80254.1 alpha-galactosidase [Oenococcus oeni IOEB_0607]KMQ38500.1 alpha-galactosidase [Oenococcus oeni]OIK61417.1 alpha-galactosidase [Oenococcus oeni]OIL95256.1 alpha-galactosidase [Oenococcus oeni]